jgi:RES domain-containing protein
MAFGDLVARIDALGPALLETTAFRHVSVGGDPRTGVGARIHGGRWNPPDSFSTLYLGLSEETVRAEWERAAKRQGLRLEDFLPREFYSFNVVLHAVVDLRSSEARHQVGLTDADITADDQRACQRVGEAAHFASFEGVVAPSATGSGEIVAVFLDQLKPDSRLEPTHLATWAAPPA